MTLRTAARDLDQVPVGQCVHVAGRVVASDAGSFTLQDDTGCVSLQSSAQPAVGLFAQVTLRLDPQNLRVVEAVTLSGIANDKFMRAESDWSVLTGSHLQNLRSRQALLRAARSFMDTLGLLEVETPAIVPCPGLDVHLDAVEVLGMRGPRWLHTSPEYQMKRLLTTALPGVYQIGKAFRRGERGRLHEPEFTLLEWYRSFSDAEQMMCDTEALAAHVATALLGATQITGSRGPIELAPPWQRMTVADAFDRYAGTPLEGVLSDEERFYRLLVDKIEPELGHDRPVFLTHYPARMASLARLCPDDPRFAERFEAYVDGIELCNGFSELVDPVEQRKRFELDQVVREKLGRSVYPIDERFMTTLAEGLPPSGGNALGFDRLLMLLVGAKHIEEVVALPCARV